VNPIKKILLTIAGISLAALVGCSEQRAPTEQEYNDGKAWLECSQQEKWDKVYEQSGTFGRKFAIQKECGEEPPYVPDD